MVDPQPQRPVPVPGGAGEPYDELYASAEEFRPHWKHYFSHLESIGQDEAKARWTKVKQLLQENGASYNVYDDSAGTVRPWRLSPIPYLVPANDWQHISAGVAQRARLLASLLTDLYGPQRVLMTGDLPYELVFDNPHFLRPLHGFGGYKYNWLPICAVDLVRAPDGSFLVLEETTQAPAGMGYALENRVIVAQALPDLLRHCNVERLASFYRLLRERLNAAAPYNRDAPRIALMTPGPYSPTYFEQSYLAKYLGISLVQGEDLAVRNDRVYLKTLGGLQPIDVVLRRVFDDYCDPLELRPDSALGVPGLVQAVRAGNVACLNPLGTGLLETPAIQAYLPKLCRRLLNEELRLPSVPTYYCGDREHLAMVFADFESMVIKPVHGVGRTDSTFVQLLEPSARETLRHRISAAPHRYVAQRFVPSSRTPVIVNGSLRTRAFVLRCFAHASNPGDYDVMPGGLGLVAATDDEVAVSMYHGARSKDIWVLSNEPITSGMVLPPQNPSIEVSRAGGDLPSRVADNLFWLGRYTERTEALCRLARVTGARLSEYSGAADVVGNLELTRLLDALRTQVQLSYSGPVATRPFEFVACEEDFRSAIVDDGLGGSVVSTLAATLRVSRVVRDRISHDTWRILTSLDDAIARLRGIDGRDRIPRLTNELSRLITALAGFSGLVMENMTRGFAWRFLDMGRRIERGITLVTLLRATLVPVSEREAPLVEAVLEVADSGMTYRRRYPASLLTAPAVDLLLADDTNPRSVLFQVKTLAEHVAALPPLSSVGVRSQQQRLVLSASTKIDLTEMGELCRIDPDTNARPELDGLLQHLGKVLPAISDSLTETYLYHANVARHLRHAPAELQGLEAGS